MARTLTELLDEVIAREGGYVNHPADRGGPTRFGITIGVARNHGYTGEMADFPEAEARAIYGRVYWLRPGFDKIAEIAPTVAAELFDTGINMGPSIATRFLQKALNALNRNGKDYPDCAVDGKVGQRTLDALRAFLDTRGPKAERVMMRAIECQQGNRYIDLAESRPANEAFVYGWLEHRINQELAL